MSKSDSGKIIIRFYKKRTESFLVKLCLAGFTFGEEDIHDFRLELKRLKALIYFMKMFAPASFRVTTFQSNIQMIVKYSGMIRDAQLQLRTIENPQISAEAIALYRVFLQKEELRLRKWVKGSIDKYNGLHLLEAQEQIKKLYREGKLGKITEQFKRFIVFETIKIKNLNSETPTMENMHEVRKHLKAIGTIGSLLQESKPDKGLKKMLLRVKATESGIGNEHDKFVLAEAIEQFLNKRVKPEDECTTELKNYAGRLRQEVIQSLESQSVAVKKTVNKIMDKSLKLSFFLAEG
jgi:CHAD domain-containing protein